MSLQIGIVGLPNVGKSTLFNALTRSHGAQVANYPFCTIDPNVGVVEVHDERLHQLARVSRSQKIVPAIVEFVDIAGIVKGASQGEGLGNKFLSHIRDVDAILQVLRVFDDENITHVDGKIDPKRDMEVINAELILADLETIEKRIGNAEKKGKAGDKLALIEFGLLTKLKDHLGKGNLASTLHVLDSEQPVLKELHLLTAKPFLYVLNVQEDQLASFDEKQYKALLHIPESIPILPISAKLEAEMVELSDEEGKEYLKSLGIEDTGLHRLIQTAFEVLGLQYYFTSGEKESRAWTIHKGWKAPQAAGVIHTDFEKGFIKADVVNWQDFVSYGGWAGAREKGKVRTEGKEYVMQEGDVVLFKFNV